MTSLRESLNKLSTKFGLDFGDEIARLDEDIAERDTPDPLEEGSGLGGKTPPTHHHVVTDEDVRQMFRTLAENN
jgi:hypothetical protein